MTAELAVLHRLRAAPELMEAVGRFWLGFLEEEEDGFLHVPWSFFIHHMIKNGTHHAGSFGDL